MSLREGAKAFPRAGVHGLLGCWGLRAFGASEQVCVSTPYGSWAVWACMIAAGMG